MKLSFNKADVLKLLEHSRAAPQNAKPYKAPLTDGHGSKEQA